MPRYIDADALKARMLSYYGCVNENTAKENYRGETLMNYEVADMIDDCIDNAPTADVVEVVRCKDCKFFVSEVCRHDLAMNLSRANDFCSYGERKEQLDEDQDRTVSR